MNNFIFFTLFDLNIEQHQIRLIVSKDDFLISTFGGPSMFLLRQESCRYTGGLPSPDPMNQGPLGPPLLDRPGSVLHQIDQGK